MSEDRSMTVLVHGASKVGKSTLSVTAPAPRLYLDVESASRFLPIQKVRWDPSREEPPKADGTWDTCVVAVRDYETMVQVYRWLQSGQHEFASVIVDSISELQVRLVDQVAGRRQMQTQDWGDIFRQLAGMLRDLRDLTMHPTNPLESLVLTAMTRDINGFYKPYLQGQVATVAPYLFDLVAYLYIDTVPNEDPFQPPHEFRRLLTRKSGQFEAGERLQGRLPAVVDNPHIEQMMDAVFGKSTDHTPTEGTTEDAE